MHTMHLIRYELHTNPENNFFNDDRFLSRVIKGQVINTTQKKKILIYVYHINMIHFIFKFTIQSIHTIHTETTNNLNYGRI